MRFENSFHTIALGREFVTFGTGSLGRHSNFKEGKQHRETAVRGEDETTRLRGISLIRPMFYSTIDHNEL